MAIGNNAKTKTSSAKAEDRKPADGFLNISVTAADGTVHRIKATIPLFEDDRVHRALMRKGEVTLTGSVHLIAPESEDELEL